MRSSRPRPDGGFSFVELLAYMAIAALLILAAVPQFNNHRGRAAETLVRGDMRALSAQYESYNVTKQTYPKTTEMMRDGEIMPTGSKWAYGQPDKLIILTCTDGDRYTILGFPRTRAVLTLDSRDGFGQLPRDTYQSAENICGTVLGYPPRSGSWAHGVWPGAGK